MLRSIKAVIILGALIVSALYGLLLAQIILAEPKLPHILTGTVIIGGAPATDGDVQIRVKTVGNVLLPLTTNSSNVPTGDGTYIFGVRADDPSTTLVEGGKPGEELKFFVVFNPGTAQEKEEAASTSVSPVLFLAGGRNGDPTDPGKPLNISVQVVPVNAPVLVAPIQNAVVTDSTPLFDWNKPTEGEPTFYRLQVVKTNDSFDSGPFVLNELLDSGTPPPDQFQTTQPLADAVYKWRVTVNGLKSSEEIPGQELRNFTLDATVPQTPVLQVPIGGTQIRDNTPKFEWSVSADPPFTDNVTYTLQVASGDTTGDFSNLPRAFSQSGVVDQDPSTPNVVEFTIPNDDKLAAGNYIWRVRAVDSAGNLGSFSTPETFVLLRAINLALEAVPQVLRFGGDVNVSIAVKPQDGLAVNEVRAFLNFDPSAMEVTAPITVGTTFNHVTTNSFDNDLGRIDFVASGNAVSGDFVLAQITFKTKKPGLAEILTSVIFNLDPGARESDALFDGDSVVGDTAPADVTILKPSLDIRLDDSLVIGKLVGNKFVGTREADFSNDPVRGYKGLAKDEVVEVTISVARDTNQTVQAVDVHLNFDTADFIVNKVVRVDNDLPLVLTADIDNQLGTIDYSAQVNPGDPPVPAGIVSLARVQLQAKRATRSFNLGFSEEHARRTNAGLKGVDVLRNLIGFPVDLELQMTVKPPFALPFNADVEVVVRPNGNRVRAVDALLSYTPQDQQQTVGIRVNQIRTGDGTLEEELVRRINPNATIDIAAFTIKDLPKRELVLAVLEITSSKDPSTSDRIDFITAFPKGSVGTFDGVALPVRVIGVSTKVPPPDPVTNLRKQPDSLDLDNTPTFRWDPPLVRPAAGIKEFDVAIIGADGTPNPSNQAVSLRCFDASGALVAGNKVDCLKSENIEKVTSFEFTSVTLADGLYILQVAIVDNFDQTGEERALGFLVDTTPPSKPEPDGKFAVDGVSTNAIAPVLAWLTSKDDFTDAGDLEYDVEVASGDDFSAPLPASIKELRALSWQVKPALAPNRYYFWSVRSFDQATRLTAVPFTLEPKAVDPRGNQSAPSAPKSFLIDTIRPNDPPNLLVTRTIPDEDENLTTEFRWSRSEDPGFDRAVPPAERSIKNTGSGVARYLVRVVGSEGFEHSFDDNDCTATCVLNLTSAALASKVGADGKLRAGEYTVTVTPVDWAGNTSANAATTGTFDEGPAGVVLNLGKVFEPNPAILPPNPDKDPTPTFKWDRIRSKNSVVTNYQLATADKAPEALTDADFSDFTDAILFQITGDGLPVTDGTVVNSLQKLQLTFKNPLADGPYRLSVRARTPGPGSIEQVAFTVDTQGPVISNLKQVLDDASKPLAQDKTPSFAWDTSDVAGVKFHRTHIESVGFVDMDAPGTPVLSTPVEGNVLTTGSKPTLSWNAVIDNIGLNTGGGIKYIVELGLVSVVVQSKDAGFTGDFHRAIVDGTGADKLSFAVTTALSAGSYKWHVRAVDQSGNLSNFSELRTFKVGPTPVPPAPTNLSPRNGTDGSNTTPEFQWTLVKGFLYGLEIASSGTQVVTGGAFATTIFTADQIATLGFTLPIASALNTGDYTWHVRAELGTLASVFSQAGTFTVTGGAITGDQLRPTRPDLKKVISGDDTTPEFVWGQSTGGNLTPLTYTLLVLKSGDQLETVYTKSGILPPDSLTGDVRFTLPLDKKLDAGNYLWQVRASDAVGNAGPFSEQRSFEVDPDGTNPVVSLLNPKGVAGTARPTFSWTGEDSNGLTFTLQVYSGDFPPTGDLVINVPNLVQTSFTPARQLAGGSYVWRVEAKDDAGNTGDATGDFTVAGAPASLTVEPFLSVEGQSTYSPTLRWKGVPGAIRYEVSLDNGPFRSNGSGDQTGDSIRHTLPTAISLGGHHLFQVRAIVPGSEVLSGISSIFFLDGTTAGNIRNFTVQDADLLPLGRYQVRVNAQDVLDQAGADEPLQFGVTEVRISLIPSQPPAFTGGSGSVELTIQLEPGGSSVNGAQIFIDLESPLISSALNPNAGVVISGGQPSGSTLDFTATFDETSDRIDLGKITVTSSSVPSTVQPKVTFSGTAPRLTQALSRGLGVPAVLSDAIITLLAAQGGGGGGPAPQPPVANAGVAQTVNEGATVTLNGSATDPNAADIPTLTFAWSASPAVTLTGDNTATPSFLAADGPAAFTFTLTVTDQGGLVGLGATTVTVVNVVPVIASVTADPAELPSTGGNSVITVLATDAAGLADPLTYSFDCNGDNVTFEVTGTDNFATCTFTQQNTGDNVVNVRVDDGDAGIATSSATITIALPPLENLAPTANAGENQTLKEGDTVTVDGSGSTDSDGQIVNYRWEFGDNTAVDGSTPVQTHIYADDGIFAVRLIVTDDKGGTGDATVQVTVENVNPIVVTGTIAPADEGTEIRLAGTFTDAGANDTHSATIAWGDGTEDTIATFLSPFARGHVYTDNSPSSGPFTIVITVMDDAGEGTSESTVVIRNVAPVVNAGPDLAVIMGDSADFAGSFTDPGTDDTHTIAWTFGDGQGSDQLTPSHDYQATGEFDAVLTVTDDDGGQSTDDTIVRILNPANVTTGLEPRDFILIPTDPKAGELVFARFRLFNVSENNIENGAVELLVNGALHHTFDGIDLRAGQNRQLRLPNNNPISSNEPGTFAVQVGVLVETFTIKAGVKVISNIDLDKRVVDVGDVVRVSADVTNEGGITESFLVQVVVGDPLGSVYGQTREKRVRLTPFPAEGSSNFVIRNVPITPNARPGEYTVTIDTEQDFFQVVQPLVAAVGREYSFNPNTTDARDAQGNKLDPIPGGQVSFKTGSIALSIPIRAARGVKVNSFVDTTSGISIIGKNVEVPIKDPLSGQTLIRLLGTLVGDGLLGTGTDDGSAGIMDQLRMLTAERKQDLSADDPNVGTLGASVQADLKKFPPGVSIELSIKKALRDEDRTSVELQARAITPDPKVVANEAGVISVKATNLPNDDLGEVVITTRISIDWILEFGRSNVRIAHVGVDGNVEILKADCVSDPDNRLEFICTAKSDKGFSQFSLLALVDAPANFEASNLVVHPVAVEPGEGVKITIDIANRGSQAGSFSAILQLQGPGDANLKPEQVQEITLLGATSGEIAFFVAKELQGEYRVDVEGQQGLFDVARTLLPADLRFSQLRFAVSSEDARRLNALGLTPPDEVTPGTAVTMTMFVRNNGDQDGRTELAAKINGAVAQIQSYLIPAQGGIDVTFVFTPPADGEYLIELVDVDETVPPLTGKITVITPAGPARVVYSSVLAIAPLEVLPGEDVTLNFGLTNFGESPETATVVLLLNGVEAARQTITVNELSEDTVTFTIKAPADADDYTVTIAKLVDGALNLQPPTGTFRVLQVIAGPDIAGPDIAGPDIRIVRVTEIPGTVTPGQPVTIVVELTNRGDQEGPRTLILLLNGREIDRQVVSIGAALDRTVNFTFPAPTVEGDHTLEVAGFERRFNVVRVILEAVLNLIPPLNISPATVDPGQQVTIQALVRNSGEADDTTDVILRINDVEVERKSVPVSGEDQATVTFRVTRNDPGDYRVRIEIVKGDEVRIGDGSFTVRTPVVVVPVPKVANVILVPASLSVNPAKVDKGEAVTITVNVTNTGNITGPITVTLRLDGEDVESRTLDAVDAGETVPVTFALLEKGTGTHTVEVGNLTGTFEVSRPAPIAVTIVLMLIFGLLVAGLVFLLYARAAGLRPTATA